MSTIRVCSACGNLGQMEIATDEEAYRVLTAVKVDMRRTPRGWRVRVWICPACETPIVELYPESIAQSARRALLGYDDAPLEIDEGGAG